MSLFLFEKDAFFVVVEAGLLFICFSVVLRSASIISSFGMHVSILNRINYHIYIFKLYF